MELRAFSKINLDLRILGRRDDGYHELRTVLQTIDWADELSIEPSDVFEFRAAGAPEDETNLVVKAVRVFEKLTGQPAAVKITLTKHVPSGAGLGGGSADAAVALMGLQRFYGLKLDEAEVLAALGRLGSDIPFFWFGGRAMGVGRGNEISPMDDGPRFGLVVIHPGFSINTAEAYSWLTVAAKTPTINGFCAQSVSAEWEGDPRNDFESVVLARHPLLRSIKEELVTAGAKRAALSGSGSAVFGIFESDEEAVQAAPRLKIGTARAVRPLTREEYHRNIWGVAKW